MDQTTNAQVDALKHCDRRMHLSADWNASHCLLGCLFQWNLASTQEVQMQSGCGIYCPLIPQHGLFSEFASPMDISALLGVRFVSASAHTLGMLKKEGVWILGRSTNFWFIFTTETLLGFNSNSQIFTIM